MGRERTYEAVVQGWWKATQVQPDVERADGRNLHFQPQFLKSLKDVVSFCLEMFLEGELNTQFDSEKRRTTLEYNDIEISYPLLGDMLGVQQRDSGELEPTNLVSIGRDSRRWFILAYG